MKKFSTLILILHALIEGLMGLAMIFAPQKLAPSAGPSEQDIMMTYGFSAITMALVVVWFWPHRRQVAAVAMTMGILATFHMGLTLAGVVMAMKGTGFVAIILIHGAFAIGFWLLWMRRQQLAGIS